MDAQTVARAVAALGKGELIGLPTETVYGLAGDARSDDAVRRIFALKGRPATHPIIVHVADAAALGEWAHDVPAAATALAECFWPGPLTLILRRAAGVSDLLTGGQPTIGLRVPAHPVALHVLRDFGRGIAAPSANRFGHISPTTAAHVRAEFGAELPIVLDGGPCSIGIESTIVDVSGRQLRILRPGQIPADAIGAVLGAVPQTGTDADSPRVSGSLASHYAPRTPAELVPKAQLGARLAVLSTAGQSVQVLARERLPGKATGLALPADPGGYARGLYAALRALDAQRSSRILIESPPESPAWAAIIDRLRRASAGLADDEVP